MFFVRMFEINNENFSSVIRNLLSFSAPTFRFEVFYTQKTLLHRCPMTVLKCPLSVAIRLIRSFIIITVKCLKNGRDQHKVSVNRELTVILDQAVTNRISKIKGNDFVLKKKRLSRCDKFQVPSGQRIFMN